ncbi:MAG: hypothetical protein AAGA68_10685 [Pseudomonadota bacterium]
MQNRTNMQQLAAVTTLALLSALGLSACGGGDAGNAPSETNPGSGASGNSEPSAVSGLAVAAPLQIVGERAGRLALDTSALQVKRDVSLLFVTGNNAGEFNPFLQEVVGSRRDDIFALDYTAGTARPLFTRQASGTTIIPLTLFAQGSRLHQLYFGGGTSLFLQEIDSTSGNLISETELAFLAERCLAVVGEDFFYAIDEDFFVVRDFAAQGFVAQGERLAHANVCGDGVSFLDGALVGIEYPTDESPNRERITAWEIDTQTGERLAALAETPASALTDQAAFREPQVALADDGIYVLAYDFVSIELWFIGYGRRPGEAGDADPSTPELLGRIEMPFFANIIPGDGTLSVEEIFTFAARGGVVTLNLRLREQAGDGTFFWGPMVVLDVYEDAVDLIDLGTRVYDAKVLTGD